MERPGNWRVALLIVTAALCAGRASAQTCVPSSFPQPNLPLCATYTCGSAGSQAIRRVNSNYECCPYGHYRLVVNRNWAADDSSTDALPTGDDRSQVNVLDGATQKRVRAADPMILAIDGWYYVSAYHGVPRARSYGHGEIFWGPVPSSAGPGHCPPVAGTRRTYLVLHTKTDGNLIRYLSFNLSAPVNDRSG